jgi:hypothetical protein
MLLYGQIKGNLLVKGFCRVTLAKSQKRHEGKIRNVQENGSTGRVKNILLTILNKVFINLDRYALK